MPLECLRAAREMASHKMVSAASSTERHRTETLRSSLGAASVTPARTRHCEQLCRAHAKHANVTILLSLDSPSVLSGSTGNAGRSNFAVEIHSYCGKPQEQMCKTTAYVQKGWGQNQAALVVRKVIYSYV